MTRAATIAALRHCCTPDAWAKARARRPSEVTVVPGRHPSARRFRACCAPPDAEPIGPLYDLSLSLHFATERGAVAFGTAMQQYRRTQAIREAA